MLRLDYSPIILWRYLVSSIISALLLMPGNARGAPSTQCPVTQSDDLLDFRLLAPDPKSETYQKQRLVLFMPSGEEIAHAEEDEKVSEEGVRPSEHFIARDVNLISEVRKTMIGALADPRFHVVVPQHAAPAGLAQRTKMSVDTAMGVVKDDWYAAYSIKHADFLLVPNIVQRKAVWEQKKVEKKTKNGKTVSYMAWSLKLEWTVEVALFERSGDGYRLAGKKEISKSLPEWRAIALVEKSVRGVSYESSLAHIKVPTESCDEQMGVSSIGPVEDATGVDIVGGKSEAAISGVLAQCGVRSFGSSKSMASVFSTPENCGKVDNAVASGASAQKAMMLCQSGREINVVSVIAMKQLSTWIGLYDLVIAVPDARSGRGMSLGKDEGVRRGGLYRVVGSDGKRAGLAQVRKAGCGGLAGEEYPTELTRRAGELEVGQKVTEVPEIGMVVGLELGPLYLFNRGDLSGGNWYMGGTLALGYDLTRRIGFSDRVMSRAYISHFRNTDDPRGVGITSGELIFEVSKIFRGRFSGFVGAGFGGARVVQPNVLTTEDEDDKLHASAFTLNGQLGLDLLLTARVAMRLRIAHRQSLGAVDLEDDEGRKSRPVGGMQVPWGSAGSLSGPSANLSVEVRF